MPRIIKLSKAAAFCLILHSVCYATPTHYIESIQSFTSSIVVKSDASLDVTEKIALTANQEKIRHGITRWLQTHYMDAKGYIHKNHYTILSVLMDDHPTTYTMRESPHDLKVIIGERNQIIEPGSHTFTVHYRLTKGVNSLAQKDSLHWSVAGNTWDFPIEKLSVTFTLSKGTSDLQHIISTGKNTEMGYQTSNPSPNQISFTSSQALKSKEQLSILLFWPSNIIQAPINKTTSDSIIQSIRFKLLIDALLSFICIGLLVRYLSLRKQRLISQRYQINSKN